MRLYLTFLFFIVISQGLIANARTDQPPILKFKPCNEQDLPDSIILVFRKGQLIRSSDREFLKLVRDKNGYFIGSPSFLQPVYNFHITFWYTNKVKRKQVSESQFYASKNDEVEVIYEKPLVDSNYVGVIPDMKFSFSGRGSEKYKLTTTVLKNTEALTSYLSQSLNDSHILKEIKDSKIFEVSDDQRLKLTVLLNSILDTIAAVERRNMQILMTRNNVEEAEVFRFLRYELTSATYFSWAMDFVCSLNSSRLFKQTIYEFYINNKSKIALNRDSDPLAILSKRYKDYRMYEMMYETSFKTESMGFPFQAQYEIIKTVKDSILRENLLSFFIYENWFQQRVNDRSKQDSCINDALKIVKSEMLREPILEQKLFFRGSKVPDFVFEDIEGKKTSLSDLKGKVFLMDFYFLGCKGCIEFAKMFRSEVFPKFLGDSLFKVLSVSIDKKKEHWQRAMESGLYNEQSYLNLSTGKHATDHPFIKHYNNTSFPFVLLVDHQGKLIAKLDRAGSSELKILIKNALKNARISFLERS